MTSAVVFWCLACLIIGLAGGFVAHAWLVAGVMNEAEGAAYRHGYRIGFMHGSGIPRAAAPEQDNAQASSAGAA